MRPAAREDVLDLVDAVFAVNGGLLRAGDRMGRAAGITAAQWQVLGLLEHGPDTTAGVARRRGLRRQSVQDTVDRLLRAGLLARRPNPADRRAPLLFIAPAGEQALRRLGTARESWLADLGCGVDAAELAGTLRTLGIVRERLGVPSRDTPHSDSSDGQLP